MIVVIDSEGTKITYVDKMSIEQLEKLMDYWEGSQGLEVDTRRMYK